MPPVIEANTHENGEIEITLTPQYESLGEVYYTLDGTDPRAVGGAVNGIKYSDDIFLSGILQL